MIQECGFAYVWSADNSDITAASTSVGRIRDFSHAPSPAHPELSARHSVLRYACCGRRGDQAAACAEPELERLRREIRTLDQTGECVDIDAEKVSRLNQGEIPIVGLEPFATTAKARPLSVQ